MFSYHEMLPANVLDMPPFPLNMSIESQNMDNALLSNS